METQKRIDAMALDGLINVIVPVGAYPISVIPKFITQPNLAAVITIYEVLK